MFYQNINTIALFFSTHSFTFTSMVSPLVYYTVPVHVHVVCLFVWFVVFLNYWSVVYSFVILPSRLFTRSSWFFFGLLVYQIYLVGFFFSRSACLQISLFCFVSRSACLLDLVGGFSLGLLVYQIYLVFFSACLFIDLVGFFQSACLLYLVVFLAGLFVYQYQIQSTVWTIYPPVQPAHPPQNTQILTVIFISLVALIAQCSICLNATSEMKIMVSI